MKFMLIVYADRNSEAGVPPDPKLMAAVGELTEELGKAGVLVGTGGLQPTSKGAHIRFSGGKAAVTDGPFAETKEVIGGYAIVEVKSKEEAIALAKRFFAIHAAILGPSYVGEGEVRQMFESPPECEMR